ncbi:MAG TPA: DUF2283 domain-containing protein [Solirubrobacterales bacterium]
MIIHLGDQVFDDVFYDVDVDVLYLSRGKPVAAKETLASSEGHAIRLNDSGEIIGITVVNAKWLAERDGRITVSIPESHAGLESLETSAEALAPALAA